MEISLSVFLLLYLVYIVIFLFFSFFNLFHMVRYGFVSVGAWVVTVGYIVITLLGLFVSYYYIAQIDWNETFQILGSTNNIYN